MMFIAEILVSLLLIIGGVFGLVGSYSLVKLDQPMKRLHGPTKSVTLGVGAVLIASMIHAPVFLGFWTWHELLITMFITVTSPVTAFLLSKANLHLCVKPNEVPSPGPMQTWATYGPPDVPHPGECRAEDDRLM